jgi:peptidase inhibitor family I36
MIIIPERELSDGQTETAHVLRENKRVPILMRRSFTPAVTLILASLLSLNGCGDKLPTAPSDLTSGIVIYQHANFIGPSAHVTADIPDLETVRGPCVGSDTSSDSWDDCASSVRVAPGWRATLYEDPNYKGWAADVGEENAADFLRVRGPCSRDTFNDCASSVRVFRVR